MKSILLLFLAVVSCASAQRLQDNTTFGGTNVLKSGASLTAASSSTVDLSAATVTFASNQITIAKISGLQAALDAKALASNLTAETTRATNAESTLTGNVSSLSGSLAAETTRATTAESNLQPKSTNLTGISSNPSGIGFLVKTSADGSSYVVRSLGYGMGMSITNGAGQLGNPVIGTYFAAAVFTIPLGGSYTDFELKASTSNFGASGGTILYLYYHSPDPARVTVGTQTGPVPRVWFTDTGRGSGWYPDQRYWVRQNTTQSIYAIRASFHSKIPAVIAAVPTDTTITPANSTLVWVYCRLTPTDYERDEDGNVIWYPIVPTWSILMPTPSP